MTNVKSLSSQIRYEVGNTGLSESPRVNRCPSCGATGLEAYTEDRSIIINDIPFELTQDTSMRCTACNDHFYTEEQAISTMKQFRERYG